MAETTIKTEVKTQAEKPKKSNNPVVTMKQLLETGVHFGHQTKRWNPKMKPYIYTSRNDIHVIDLQKTLVAIIDAYQFVVEQVSKGKNILFVGTKKQAVGAIEEEAVRCEMPYICNRWLGGMLTNFDTIKKSITKMKEIEQWKENGIFDALGSKEQSQLNKRYTKLCYHLEGIRNLKKLPDIVFIVDTKKEEIGVHEANVLGIPIVGVVDTNCDPDLISHPIPANDDAIRTIKLLTSVIANAVIEGKENRPLSDAEKITQEIESTLEFTVTETAETTPEPKKVEPIKKEIKEAKTEVKPTKKPVKPTTVKELKEKEAK